MPPGRAGALPDIPRLNPAPGLVAEVRATRPGILRHEVGDGTTGTVYDFISSDRVRGPEHGRAQASAAGRRRPPDPPSFRAGRGLRGRPRTRRSPCRRRTTPRAPARLVVARVAPRRVPQRLL